MKLQYFPETDTLYIELRPGVHRDAAEVADDIVLSFDAKNEVLGIEIERAAERFDLSEVDLGALPLGGTRLRAA